MTYPYDGYLTEIDQQIHSLRASGVRSSHAARALGSEVSTFRKSGGRSCATPPEISLIIRLLAPLGGFCFVRVRSPAAPPDVRITPKAENSRSPREPGESVLSSHPAGNACATAS